MRRMAGHIAHLLRGLVPAAFGRALRLVDPYIISLPVGGAPAPGSTPGHRTNVANWPIVNVASFPRCRPPWPRFPDFRSPSWRNRASATLSRCVRSSPRRSCAGAALTRCAGSTPPPRPIPAACRGPLTFRVPGGIPVRWRRRGAAAARVGEAQGSQRCRHGLPARVLAGGLLGPRGVPGRPTGAPSALFLAPEAPSNAPSPAHGPPRAAAVAPQRQLLRLRRLRGAAHRQAPPARRPHDRGHGGRRSGAGRGQVRTGLRRPPPHPPDVHVPVLARAGRDEGARRPLRRAAGARGQPPRRRVLPRPLVRGAGADGRRGAAVHCGGAVAAGAAERVS